MTAEIIKSKSIITKKKKKHCKIVLLAKTKINTTEILNFSALIDSCNNRDKFISVHSSLTEYNDIKETVKNLNTSTVHQISKSI